MKKLLFIALTFIFLSSINAQSPSLSIINITGSNSITCTYPSINYQASVSNYTAGSLTYTWVSLSGTASGTNVTLSNPSQYTVIAFNTANSFSLQQVFSIGINTTIPSSTVTPTIQNINCAPPGQVVTFTAITTNTATNITQSWTSPFSTGAAISNGTISIYSLAGTGVFTNCITNNVNGCSTCKTATVVSSNPFPTLTVTSPTQFNLGCGSTSITSINISNVLTWPPASTTSFTVLPPSFVGPSYGYGSSLSYPANNPGQYIVIVQDNMTGCETKIPVSIIQNTVSPNISISASTKTLSCYTPSVALQANSTNTNVTFAWSFPGPGTATTSAINVSTTPTGTFTGNYSLSVTGANSCISSTVIPFYQNINPPVANILPSGSPILTCTTPTVTLANSSTSNIPPVFPHPLPVVVIAWYRPAPQTSVASVSSYTTNTPGVHTLVVQDQNNGCTAITTKTVIDNRIYPLISPSMPFNINCPVTTATIFPNISGPTTGYTYTWTGPATANLSTPTQSSTVVDMPGIYNVYITNISNGCSYYDAIDVEICAGILEKTAKASAISVFPNPGNGLVTVEIAKDKEIMGIEVYSALGILVKKQALNNEKTLINLQNEANGVYFIYILEEGNTIKTAKIVKQ